MDYGIVVEVTGEIIPFSFANESTGEQVGLVHIRVPGDVVGVSVDPSLAEKMREGEVWRVRGLGSVSKKKGQLRIVRPEEMTRLREPASANGPRVTFDVGAAASKKVA